MKKTLFALLSLVALFSARCTKDAETTQILVRFQNTLSQDITDARLEFDDVHKTDIGLIPAGSVTDYIAFDYFQTGDAWPMGILNGEKNGEPFSAFSGLWCGTGVDFKQLEAGQYTIVITQVGDISNPFYQLKFVE